MKETDKVKKKKKKKPYAQRLLPFIIFAVVIYAIADFILQIKTGVEISPTLTTVWFSFWGVEIISLAGIKHSKIKNTYSSAPDNNIDDMGSMEETGSDDINN